jgi:hypothetical protein
LNTVFLEWMERLQKRVQVDGEYVGWAKRIQYIEIDSNRGIRVCYTLRGTHYRLRITFVNFIWNEFWIDTHQIGSTFILFFF